MSLMQGHANQDSGFSLDTYVICWYEDVLDSGTSCYVPCRNYVIPTWLKAASYQLCLQLCATT